MSNAGLIRSGCSKLRSSSACAIALSSLLLLLIPLPLDAQDPAKIHVTFHSRVPLYALPSAVEKQVSDRMAKACATLIGHWNFSPGADADFPQLKVELTKDMGGNHQLLMSLVIESGSQPVASWPERLFKPGDFTRLPVLPKENEAPDMFGGALEQDLLPHHAGEIRQTLMESVPLGKDVVLIINSQSSSAPRAILPLDWTRYCHEFAESEFVILVKTANDDKVKLYSVGLSRSLAYKPDSFKFHAIGVQLNLWQAAGSAAPDPIANHRNELQTLKPVFFQLKAPKRFVQSCGESISSPAFQ